MSYRKLVSPNAVDKAGLCPVCGKRSYSLHRTHPQCAVARADAVDRASRIASGEQFTKQPQKFWSKSCPKCKQLSSARQLQCKCGYRFNSKFERPTDRSGFQRSKLSEPTVKHFQNFSHQNFSQR
jgi:hypothetical protein